MFGHDALPSRIFAYGAKPPITQRPYVLAQLQAAHRYRNTLVELERWRRDRVAEATKAGDEAQALLEGQLANLADQIGTLRQSISQRNAAAKRKMGSDAERTQLQQWRQEEREVRMALRVCQHTAREDPTVQAALEAINLEAAERQRRLRANCGVWWGSYLCIEQGMQAARRGPPPRFQRWTGNGKLAVQLQGGMTADEAFAGTDTRLRIEHLADDAWEGRSRAKKHTRIWLRIGSIGRDPLWTVVPFTMHRPLPPDCHIKWVYLQRRIVPAWREEWSVLFVVSAAGGFDPEDAAIDGAVGIDVGWRLVAEGLRVAYWVGSDGAEGQLVLPMTDVTRWAKAESLQSIRDTNFDAMRVELGLWLDGHESPDWLRERLASLSHWRSAARLVAVQETWQGQRFPEDGTILPTLDAWARQDRHLASWIASQRLKAVRWRDDQFRQFAAMLRRRYRRAFIEDTNWRKLQRRQAPEEETTSGALREHARIAAVGRLLQYVRESISEVVAVNAAYTTQRCHVCHAIVAFDATNLFVTCPSCGLLIDQDARASRNLLELGASGGVMPESQEALA